MVGGPKAVWLHLEQMDEGCWWLDVGGVVVNVQADPDGTPRRVSVELEPVDGVTYGGDYEDHPDVPPVGSGRAGQ